MICKGNSTNYEKQPREKRQSASGKANEAHMNGHAGKIGKKPSEIRNTKSEKKKSHGQAGIWYASVTQPGAGQEPGKNW